MRELKVIDVDKMADVRSLSGQFYRKSEVDEVIEYLQNQLSLARTGLIKLLAKAQHEAHHNKYKMCLAIARCCRLEQERIELIECQDITDDDFDKLAKGFYKKWPKLIL